MLEPFENRLLFSGETGLRGDYFNAPTDQFNAESPRSGAADGHAHGQYGELRLGDIRPRGGREQQGV